ncbi:MAG: DUF1254 domain-containing protein [Pseudomonadota bacterium]
MMRRWAMPLLLGALLAGVAYHIMLVQTPRVLMRFATHRIAGATGYNVLYQAPLATADSRAIVRPSPDLAYASCPFDLSDSAVLIDVAPVPAPYWSLSIFDERTDVVFVRNNIQARGKAIRVALIAHSGEPVPPGYEPVLIKGDSGIALIRTLVDDPARFPQIDAARRASSCATEYGFVQASALPKRSSNS